MKPLKLLASTFFFSAGALTNPLNPATNLATRQSASDLGYAQILSILTADHGCQEDTYSVEYDYNNQLVEIRFQGLSAYGGHLEESCSLQIQVAVPSKGYTGGSIEAMIYYEATAMNLDRTVLNATIDREYGMLSDASGKVSATVDDPRQRNPPTYSFGPGQDQQQSGPTPAVTRAVLRNWGCATESFLMGKNVVCVPGSCNAT
ncbi:hypothetical protein QBC35DRAFT_456997 [Podospora australis]|uniref:Uncharacterized protein n=1 Tax=Podospora australis TaxID=1536484 RepID=A0AAN6WIH6_9PEZI|nr:hypothetical protein QBC35DRAFT_456997 [Podospora australis]